MNHEELLAYLSFSSFPGIGPLRFKLLLNYFQTAERAWNAKEKELLEVGLSQNMVNKLREFKRTFSAEKYFEEVQKKNIKIVTWNDSLYPKRLKEISDPPFLIYIRGDIKKDWNLERAIAVVGTRKITSYGRAVTQKIVSGLVASGCLIISGLAYGVDAVAHESAIESGGNTFGVLGCGVDIIHPVSNTELYWKIVKEKGLMISEYPVGQYAAKGLFPARNRIVSGLSLGVVVTEGAQNSGSLITARLALEQGREVFAVPGPITSELSDGTFKLIREGATPVANASDILDALGISNKPISQLANNPINDKNLSKEEKKIIELLTNENLHVDDLIIATEIPSFKIGSILTMMELKGVVKNQSGLWMLC